MALLAMSLLDVHVSMDLFTTLATRSSRLATRFLPKLDTFLVQLKHLGISEYDSLKICFAGNGVVGALYSGVLCSSDSGRTNFGDTCFRPSFIKFLCTAVLLTAFPKAGTE